MYKSSGQTFFFKYIHPFIMIAGGLAVFLIAPESLGDVNSGFFKAFCVAYLWMFIFLVQIPFRLKRIEADKEGVKFTSNNSTQLIKYEQIEYIAKFDLAAPWFVTIKYKDEQTNLSKKIAFMPNAKGQVPFKEDVLSQFIKENMKLKVPHYDDAIHPSTLQNVGILFVLALPVMGLMFYFMSDNIF